MTMKDHQQPNLRPSLKWALLLVVACMMQAGNAFTVQPAHHLATKSTSRPVLHLSKLGPSWNSAQKSNNNRQQVSATQLGMYNLPPSGGGGGGGNNELADIAKGVFGLVLVVAFFASPVGGFVLGLFNSLLLLSILTPVILTIGFQTWQYFNTIDAPCPNCAAPVKALKTTSDGESQPTICYNCGAILQANYDNTGIDNVTGRNSVMDDDGGMDLGSIFDFFGGGGGGGIPDMTTTTTTTTTLMDDMEQKETRRKREQTIIDVEVEREDKPWQ